MRSDQYASCPRTVFLHIVGYCRHAGKLLGTATVFGIVAAELGDVGVLSGRVDPPNVTRRCGHNQVTTPNTSSIHINTCAVYITIFISKNNPNIGIFIKLSVRFNPQHLTRHIINATKHLADLESAQSIPNGGDNYFILDVTDVGEFRLRTVRGYHFKISAGSRGIINRHDQAICRSAIINVNGTRKVS